ncbi:MAG TPA: hypothetical protein VIY70_02435 [Acidimicrobiia bacterium]
MGSKRGRFVWAVVVLTAVATATPVAAKGKPGGGGAPVFDEGKTCAESADQFATDTWAEGDAKTVTLTPDESVVCVDVGPWDGTAYSYTFEITAASENLRGASALVKDSHPGDMCMHYTEIDPSQGLTTEPIAAVIDACGDAYTDSDPALAFGVFADFRGKQGSVTVVITRD